MPTAPLNCLEQLVGLAPAELPCFPFPAVTAPDALDWITKSSREGSPGGGVWVSQLAGLNFQAVRSDPTTDLYERLHNARADAARYVRQAIQQAPKFSANVPRFTRGGLLGKAGNGSVYQGGATLTFTTGNAPAGGYVVSGLGLLTTTTALGVPILLDGQLVATLSSTNIGVMPVAPFTIPFDGQAHVLTATLPAGVLPLSGQLYCTTGCNSKAPGTFGESVALRLPHVTSASTNAGFLLSVAERCLSTASDAICYATSKDAYGNPVSDELADALAQAVVGMSAYYFLFGLTSIEKYSRYTLLDQKQMSAAGARFKEIADQNIAWLASPSGLSTLANPCYTCGPAPGQPYTTHIA